MSELLILIEGDVAGRIRADNSGRLSLDYEAAWRESPQGYSISVSMALARITYPHKAVWAYLWNLLPENPNVALAVLLGRPPEGFHVDASNLDGIRLPAVAAGTPSQLLLRRPDVAEAESNLAAAHANVQAARAAFLPQFSLSGSEGFSGTAIDALVHGTSLLWEGGAQLLQTIFDGGKLIGEKNLAYATQQELVASYQSAVLNAYADVETALGQVRNDAREEADLRGEVSEAREAFRISKLQYKEGVADLLNILQAQQTLFAARDQLAQVRLARMQSVVHLYEALGGGWTEPSGDRTQFSVAAGSRER